MPGLGTGIHAFLRRNTRRGCPCHRRAKRRRPSDGYDELRFNARGSDSKGGREPSRRIGDDLACGPCFETIRFARLLSMRLCWWIQRACRAVTRAASRTCRRAALRLPPHNSEGWSAARRWCGSPHPWPALRSGRSRKRPGPPVHDADRRAFRRSIAAIFVRGRSRRTDLGPRLPPGANLAPVVQQAPCARIVVSVGRAPEASREPG